LLDSGPETDVALGINQIHAAVRCDLLTNGQEPRSRLNKRGVRESFLERKGAFGGKQMLAVGPKGL